MCEACQGLIRRTRFLFEMVTSSPELSIVQHIRWGVVTYTKKNLLTAWMFLIPCSAECKTCSNLTAHYSNQGRHLRPFNSTAELKRYGFSRILPSRQETCCPLQKWCLPAPSSGQCFLSVVLKRLDFPCFDPQNCSPTSRHQDMAARDMGLILKVYKASSLPNTWPESVSLAAFLVWNRPLNSARFSVAVHVPVNAMR